jgi:hypothetical protein
MSTRTAVLVSITTLLAFAVSAHAKPVQWTLQDVTLVDTTTFTSFDGESYPTGFYGMSFTASGSFVYDATTHVVQDWDITVRSSPGLSGLPLVNDDRFCQILQGCNLASWSAAQFTSEFAGPFTGDSFTFSHNGGSPASTFRLELDVFKLPDSGMVAPFPYPLIYGHGGALAFGLGEFESTVTGGSLSGAVVPEPAIALGIALGMALWAGRNRIRGRRSRFLLRASVYRGRAGILAPSIREALVVRAQRAVVEAALGEHQPGRRAARGTLAAER